MKSEPVNHLHAEAAFQWSDVLPTIIVTGVASAAYGLLNPLIVVNLEAASASKFTIGMVIGIWAAPISLLGAVYSKISSRIGARQSIIAALIVSAIPIQLIGLTSSPLLWMIFQIIGGAGFGLFWVASAASLLRGTPASHRGRVMALYGLAPSLGALFGSLIPHIIGYDGWWPFSVSMVLMLSAACFGLIVRDSTVGASQNEQSAGLVSCVLVAPWLFFVALLAGFFQSIPWGLISAYALGKGLDVGISVLYLNALFLGVVLFAWSIGTIVDRRGPRFALCMLSCGTILFSILLPYFVYHTAIMLVVLVLWAPIINAFSSTTAAELGAVFSASLLVSANSVFVMFANLGEIFGPPTVGAAMDQFGPDAMPYSIAILGLVTLFATFKHGRRQVLGKQDHGG